MTTSTTNILMHLCWTPGRNLTSIFILLIGITLYFIFKRRRKMRRTVAMLKSFDQLPTIPILGSIHLFVGSLRERLEKMINVTNTYDSAFVLWLLNTPVVCIGKHEDIRTVFEKCHHVEYLNVFHKVFGDSLSMLQDEKWRKSRQTTTYAFSPNKFHQYFATLNEYSAILANDLEPLCDTEQVFNMKSYISKSNLSSITMNMSGYKMSSSKHECTELDNAISETLRMESSRYTMPILFPHIMYETYLSLFRKNRLYGVMQNFAEKIVQEKLANSTKGHLHNKPDQDTITARPKLLIDLLFKRHNADAEFTKKHVLDEVKGVIIAGFMSTSETISFVLLMLAMHHEAQEEVYKEIRAICGDETFQMEDLKELVYMEQCINETLRKFPPAVVDFRRHDEDIMLKNGKVIPAGCLIIFSLYKSHHNKEFFPNADNWDPRHFDRERITQWRQSFFPFGSGPRLCVGSKYAMMSIKIQLVHLLRRYRLTTEMKMRDIHIVFGMVTQNDSGYRLKLHSRVKNERSDMSA
uniref:Cytochrome P450 3638F3 n=1 Tax=Maconellicoccus hirsutus TaxID=177089 RepID=A0AAT9UU76_MACHI